MHRVRVKQDCESCAHFGIEGISRRCNYSQNVYVNWVGLVYKQHPEQKNINGRCPDYKGEKNGE